MWGFLSPKLSSALLGLLNVDIGWLNSALEFIIKSGVFIVFFIFYKYLVLICTSPLMSQLSEDVESNLNEDFISIPFSYSKAVKDIWRSLRLSLRNVFREILYSILILLISFFPIVTIGTAPFIFLVQSYFAGFGNMDFYLERYYNTKDTVSFVSENKALATGNGVVFMAMLAIPIIGVFFAPVLGTVAATIETHKKMHG